MQNMSISNIGKVHMTVTSIKEQQTVGLLHISANYREFFGIRFDSILSVDNKASETMGRLKKCN